MKLDIRLSVIITFFNEQECIQELVERIILILSKIINNYEIILIDDKSTDNSLKVCKDLKKQYNKSIKIISMSRTFGVQQCYMAGLEYSTGNAIITMKSDFQDPPELIIKMIDKFNEGYDVVNTIMIKRNETILRLLVFKLFYIILNILSYPKIPKGCSDYKLLSRKVVNEINKMYEYDPFFRGLPIWVGFKQTFINYESGVRKYGETKSSFLNLKPYKEFFRAVTSFSVTPLYIILLTGFIVSILSFLTLLWSIIVYFAYPSSSPAWTTIISLVLFFNGFILLSLGIVGIYIGKIFESLRGRPRYIVEQIIG